MATVLIELKKDVAGHKAGDRIKATTAAVAHYKLEVGTDYEPLGTYAVKVTPDLDVPAATPAPEAAPAAAAADTTPPTGKKGK